MSTSQLRARPLIIDGAEQYGFAYEEGTSNRMMLSIKSGIPEEVDWALKKLLFASSYYSDFAITRWPNSLDVLLEFPRKLLEYAQQGGLGWGAGTWDLEGFDEAGLRRRASESLIVLRNAAQDDRSNQKFMKEHSGLLSFIEAFMSLDPELVTDHLSEQLALVMEIFIPLIPDKAGSVNALSMTSPIPQSLAYFLESKDRSILLLALQIYSALAHSQSPTYHLFTPKMTPDPTEIGLSTAIKVLLFKDSELRLAAMEVAYQITSEPSNAITVLQRPDIIAVNKVVANCLYHDAVEQKVRVEPSDKKPDPGDGLITPAELAVMAKIPEPQRSKDWMLRYFVADPNSHVTQVEFWTSYKAAFGGKEGSTPLLPAADIIKAVGTHYPGCVAVSTTDVPPRFLITGISVRKPNSNRHVEPTKQPPPPLPAALNFINYTRLVSPTLPGQKEVVPGAVEPIPVPTGVSFLAVCILRNLSRVLLEEKVLHVNLDDDEESVRVSSTSRSRMEDKIKSGEMFGLPIPAGMANKSRTEDGDEAGEMQMSSEEVKRALLAFASIESTVRDVVMRDMALSNYLGEIIEVLEDI